MAKKHDYAMCLYIDGVMQAYNPKLGNIAIRFKDGDESDYNASLRGDMIEFYSIKHKPLKRIDNDENACYILGHNEPWDEHVFVCNHSLDRQKALFDAKIKELKSQVH